MKTIGLLGGMSWESTTSYYQHLNRLARDRLGGLHSAKLLIWSADFAAIADFQAAGRWSDAADLLVDAARRLEAAGADALLICANTMHLVANEVQAAVSVPLIHVADATAARLTAAGARRPLLLATRFTMEQAFYRDRLTASGISAVVPPADHRERLHAIIFDELVQGRFAPESRREVAAIAARALADQGADAVLLGCTEFALLVSGDDFAAPLFDTTAIHAEAAMTFALAD